MNYEFKTTPMQHQLDVLKRSWGLNEFALFMDMGTGKSKVALDNMALLARLERIDATLIVAPKGVYRNWDGKEIPQHLPDWLERNVVAWSPDTSKKNLALLETLFEKSPFQILIMNVEALSTTKGGDFAARFLKAHTAMMVVDESTTIKTRTAARTKRIVKLGQKAKYRRILTGSPVTKSPLDLFSQCEFLRPGILGHSSFWTFQGRYAKLVRRTLGAHSFNQVVGYQNLEELNHLIQPFSSRIQKSDCLDLPDKVYLKRTVELTDQQKEIYAMMKATAMAIIEGQTLSASTVLTQILRLQQVCSGIAHMDDGSFKTFPTPKLTELMQLLEETDGKVIIWTNFVHDLSIIRDELRRVYGVQSVETFYGGTPAGSRQSIVERFQDDRGPLRFFVGQPRTGGYGLTLTAASTVVYYSNSYDLENRLQSEDRAHRIGQTKSVTYVDIVAENTVDELILKALRSKIDLASAVMADGYRKWII